MAYCITKAKTNAPTLAAVRHRLTTLEAEYVPRLWEGRRRMLPEFFHYAYAPKTLKQILFMKERLDWRRSDTDCMVAALLLGALHGESQKSPSYLSNQMPRTISTKPAYSVRFWQERGLEPPERDVFQVLRNLAEYRYASEPPRGENCILETDMRKLPRYREKFPGKVQCVITSPPYLDVTSFEEDQWLRLWFLGGSAWPKRGVVSKDDRYENPTSYWRFIAEFWRMLSSLISGRVEIVIRLGGRGIDPERTSRMLVGSSRFFNRKISLVSQETSLLKGRQTGSFRPGSEGCLAEVDCHFQATE